MPTATEQILYDRGWARFVCGVSRAVRWEDPDGVEYAEEEALKMATTKEQLAKAGLGGYRLGGYLPANPSGTFTINNAYTNTSGTSANIYSDGQWSNAAQGRGLTGLAKQQEEILRVAYQKQYAPDRYIIAPTVTKPPSAGRPKESTALAWLDSEIDRMRVRL